MFPSILKGREVQGSKEQGGGGGQGGREEEREKNSSEIVIGRVGEELGRRNKTTENNT